MKRKRIKALPKLKVLSQKGKEYRTVNRLMEWLGPARWGKQRASGITSKTETKGSKEGPEG